MKNLQSVFFVCCAIVAGGPASAQVTLTFDAFHPGNEWVLIRNGYGSLQWHNFGAFNGSNRLPSEGYRTCTVSPDNVASNLGGEPASIQSSKAFNLNSAYATAAFEEGLQLRVQGFSGTNIAYENVYTLSPAAPTFVQFAYAGVDMVKFVTVPKSQFVLDNVNVTLAVSNGGCDFTVTPAERMHNVDLETDTIEVTTSTGCPWTVNNTNTWVTILSSVEHTNNGVVAYQVASNLSGLPRSGLIHIAGQSFMVSQRAFNPPGTNIVELGTVGVPSIGHTFGAMVIDEGVNNMGWVANDLIDQDQDSGAGGLLPSVSVNWDTNRYFALTVGAPPGMKFLIQPPAGSSVEFSSSLWWNSGRGGSSPYGDVSVSFSGLEGFPPDFSGEAFLSGSQGFFAANFGSIPFTNTLAFTAMKILGKVGPQQTGLGTLDFTPHLGSYLKLAYSTSATEDPGPFVSMVPQIARPLIKIAMEVSGDIVITFTGALQWSDYSTGPFTDVSAKPQGQYTIPKASLGPQRFFRAR